MKFNNSIRACACWGQGRVCAAGGVDRGVDDTAPACVVCVQRMGTGRSCGATGSLREKCEWFAHSRIHSQSCDTCYGKGRKFFGISCGNQRLER